MSGPIYVLPSTVSAKVINNSGANRYVLGNFSTYESTRKYGVSEGSYQITDIPQGHPMAIIGNSAIVITGGDSSKKSTRVVGVTATDFYYGTLTFNVTGPFSGEASLYCYYHNYMGGEDVLVYQEQSS